MPESLVQVTEGSGKKLHTWQRTIGANNVEDEFTLPGEFPYASYVAQGSTPSGAAADDLIQIMAGAALTVRIRRIFVMPAAPITAASDMAWDVIRLTSAGTGGTATTPRPFDSADPAAGATAAFGVPLATHGTAGVTFFRRRLWPVQTNSTGGGPGGFYSEWTPAPGMKSLVIPAGITNGIALRIVTGKAGVTFDVSVEFVETNF